MVLRIVKIIFDPPPPEPPPIKKQKTTASTTAWKTTQQDPNIQQRTITDRFGKVRYEFRVTGDTRTYGSISNIGKRRRELQQQQEAQRQQEMKEAPPVVTIDKEGTIRGKGFAVHPSYGDARRTHAFVERQIYGKIEPRQQQQQTPYGYLLEHADKREAFLLKSTMERKATPKEIQDKLLGVVGKRAWKSLDTKEKHEYGYRFTEWKSIPLEERKGYYGAEQHFKDILQEERTKIALHYILTHPKEDFIVPTISIGTTGTLVEGATGFKAGTKVSYEDIQQYRKQDIFGDVATLMFTMGKQRRPTYEQAEKHLIEGAKYKLFYTEQQKHEMKAKYFDALPLYRQVGITLGHTAVTSATFPITLAQTGVKFVTGKGAIKEPKDVITRIQSGKTFLPDVAQTFESVRMSPRGIIGGTVEEGMAHITGQKSFAFQQMQKYPLLTGIASVTEIAGLYTSGKMVGIGLKSGVKHVVKPTIIKLPKVYGRLQYMTGTKRFVPQTETLVFEYGTRTTVPSIMKKVVDKTFINKVASGHSQVWQHAKGWASGKLVRVKNIPVKKEVFYKGSRTGVKIGDQTFYGKLVKYRGFGKAEWINPKTLIHSQLGEKVTYTHRFLNVNKGEGGKVIGGTRHQLFEVSQVFKPKSILGYKFIKKQVVSVSEFEAIGHAPASKFILAKPSIMDASAGYGSVIKPTSTAQIQIGLKTDVSMPNLWKDTTAMQRVVPSMTHRPISHGGMLHSGYIKGSMPIQGVGSGSILSEATILGGLTAQAHNLKYESDFKYKSGLDNDNALMFRSGSKPAQKQFDDFLNIQAQAQQQARALMQTTVSMQDFDFRQRTKTPTQPKNPFPTRGTKTRLPKVIPFPKDASKKRKTKRTKNYFDERYLFREFKIPELKELL